MKKGQDATPMSKWRELETLIQPMNIPRRRKTILQNEDIRWLNRQLELTNSDHPNFKKAMSLIKELVG